MDRFVNPRATAFRRHLTQPVVFVQVLLVPGPTEVGLRHVDDSTVEQTCLRPLRVEELAAFADTTATGAYRPNKAAPNLRRGWQCSATTEAELELAMDALYPGALADWYAAQAGTAVATSFREFTSRQTGMYQCTQSLSDRQADDVTRAGCHARFCLRQRRWKSPGLESDLPQYESLVPCFEPCPLLLEFARRTARQACENLINLPLTPSDLQSLRAALANTLDHPLPDVREGDTRHPANPRRLQFLLHHLQSVEFGSHFET